MFFPYQDENPSRRWPIVTVLLIAANAGIFLLFGFSPDYENIVQRYGFIPSHPSLITLLTSIFLHSGIIHLAGNMWYLWLFGDNVESRFGSFFLPFYLVSGLAGSWLHTIFAGGMLRDVPCIGASGAISGVLGAYLVLFPGARVNCFYFFYVRAGTVSIQAGWFLGFWLFFQLLYGMLATSMGAGGVAYWAHIGGFAFGAGIGLIVRFSQRLPAEL
ncbi:MAG: rhomboid family intramembrane serine protease, partial [Deltaproteobacteria bacterium]|nr:rhomboid family intramembrane serine protease [Deltaproteobacteria bacterium]